MKHLLQQALTIITVSLLMASCGGSGGEETPEPPALKATLEESIDSYLDDNLAANDAGVAILVIKDEEVVYKKGRGMANLNANTPIDSDTGFRLGSVSKVFTAVSIMKLFEQQILSLEDSILTYIPELSSSWQDIRIHHLLSHQSGIVDLFNDLPINSWPNGVTNHDIIDYFAVNSTLEFQPGTRGEYSNTGVILLAEIVSRVTGMRFADYLDTIIFQPLAMENSYITDEFSIARDSDALNYAQFQTQYDQTFYTHGTMGQVSSINDIQLFIEGMLDHQVITSDTFDLMVQVHTPELFANSGYGYGIQVDNDNPQAFAHGGGWDGFRTFILIRMDTNIHISILTNGGDDTEAHSTAINDLINRFYAEQDINNIHILFATVGKFIIVVR